MEYDKGEFKKRYPHLHKELETEEDDIEQTECADIHHSPSGEHVPDVISYVRRARTDSEATEIVNYLRKRGEISEEYSHTMIKQIQEKGVRSFGSLRTWGNYEKELRSGPVVCGDDEESDDEEELD